MTLVTPPSYHFLGVFSFLFFPRSSAARPGPTADRAESAPAADVMPPPYKAAPTRPPDRAPYGNFELFHRCCVVFLCFFGDFWIISRAFLSSFATTPHAPYHPTRALQYALISARWLSGADWCLLSDGMPDSDLQARARSSQVGEVGAAVHTTRERRE